MHMSHNSNSNSKKEMIYINTNELQIHRHACLSEIGLPEGFISPP